MAKSRIAPIDDKSDLKIPRLELLGYLIGSRLIKYVKSHLEMNISKLYLWTDSLVVLAWIKSNKLLPPFVLRRINEIKQIRDTIGIELRYVNTKENPADIATRTDQWYEKQQLWFHGPNFLFKNERSWPKINHDNHEQCLVGSALEVVDNPEIINNEHELTKHTSEDSDDDFETNYKDENIDTTIIKKLQKKYFHDEVSGKETSLTRNLGLFLDENGILRCKGRMAYAKWSYDKRFPILLPKKSPITMRLIQKTHEDNYHVGTSHTLSILRDKYWIPQGRAQVQKVLKKCPQCVKHLGGPYKLPSTPALPSERVNLSNPFTYTGLDYLGPIIIKVNENNEKRWICLFTCLAVRAIHLELVKDLTAEECLLALRRFISVRGLPKKIISDNACQFKLTSTVLTSSYCNEKNIQWKFIPQLAPWHGGFYERLVALVKQCLKRTLDKHLLNESQMLTITKEVESVLNTRPLTIVGSEPEEVLRPIDFLTLGECLQIEPDYQESIFEGTNTKVELVSSWKRGHKILEEYKKMFINQYLPSLRERYSHSYKEPRVKSHRTPKIGDVVQIKDDSKNRINWKVGTIKNLIEGPDGECRIARVMVGDTEFTRSLTHLYPLEMGPQIENTTASDKPPIEITEQPIESTERKRAAAIRAKEKIAEWTQLLIFN